MGCEAQLRCCRSGVRQIVLRICLRRRRSRGYLVTCSDAGRDPIIDFGFDPSYALVRYLDVLREFAIALQPPKMTSRKRDALRFKGRVRKKFLRHGGTFSVARRHKKAGRALCLRRSRPSRSFNFHLLRHHRGPRGHLDHVKQQLLI
jgi:hypothetical protein